MGGWSGGTYSRFRNWVTDKANSINPQAALFDQEDDGFAAGLNNCVTKDGLNKPASAMDWNGQNLTGVNLFTAANVTVTGATLPANGLYLQAANTVGFSSNSTLRLKVDAAGAWTFGAPTAGVTITVNGFANANTQLISASVTSGQSFGLEIDGGTTSADYGLAVKNAAGSVTNFKVRGDGIVQAIDQGNTLQDVGWRDLPQNLQNGSPYTFALSDRGKTVFSAVNLTIPANASVAFPVGAGITIISGGSPITIAITTDTLTWAASGGTTGTRTLAAASVCTIIKTGTTGWIITGAGLT